MTEGDVDHRRGRISALDYVTAGFDGNNEVLYVTGSNGAQPSFAFPKASSTTTTSGNLPTFSTSSILWVQATWDGSTFNIKAQVSTTAPSDASWSSVGVGFSASGLFRTQGMMGFGAVDGDFNSGISHLSVKSYNPSTSSFDTTELVEDFAVNGSGYAGDDSGNSDYSLKPSYDSNGNLTFDGLQCYTYDAWNRLATVAHGYRDATSVHSGLAFSRANIRPCEHICGHRYHATTPARQKFRAP